MHYSVTRPVTSSVVTNGLHSTATTTTTPVRPAVKPATSTVGAAANGNGFTGLQKPVQPSSTVKEQDIKIPDFLKNTRK